MDGPLKEVDKFTNLGICVLSNEKDINTRLSKGKTAIDRLSIIWKLDLTDKIKRIFFQAAVVLILLYGWTSWTLTKRMEKTLYGNYTRMLRVILNKSWRQQSTKQKLYVHIPPITKTIQVRRTRHASHCWRSKEELISDVLMWTTAHGRAKVGRPARTYIWNVRFKIELFYINIKNLCRWKTRINRKTDWKILLIKKINEGKRTCGYNDGQILTNSEDLENLISMKKWKQERKMGVKVKWKKGTWDCYEKKGKRKKLSLF